MSTSARARPASAQQLYQALVVLKAAPEPDPVLRPDGPKSGDGPLLLGILYGKAELDAAVRAAPGARPRGLAQFLRGYCSATGSSKTRLHLLALRLIRTSAEADLGTHDPLARAASHAALAAAHLTHAHQLSQQDNDPSELATALHAAHRNLKEATRHTRA